ncbi:MAG: serine hydrolase, partial [Flavobacteriales bacterium]|nr:serine hydrolase [Flavobacteriales bacterium]
VPLGHKDEKFKNRVTGFVSDPENKGQFIKDDYDYGNGCVGDGGVFSTVEDMFKWNQSFYTEKLVKKETIDEAFKPYVLNDGTVGDYGFGWSVYKIDSNDITEHTGSWLGFLAHNLRDITDNYSVVFLTNLGSSYGSDLAYPCYNILRGIQPEDWKEKYLVTKGLEENSKTFLRDAAKNTLDQYQGSYIHISETDTLNFYISIKDEVALLAHVDKLLQEQIYAIDSDNFTNWSYSNKYSFRFGEDGSVIGVTAKSDDKPEKYFVKEAPIPTPGFMHKLRDKYSYSSYEAYTSYNNGIFRVFIPGDGDYILIPKDEKEYVFPNWPGYSMKFTTNDFNNSIKKVEYISPQGSKELK